MNDSLSLEDKCKLESWGLPKYIQLMYENRGIKTMFPWQVECLSIDGVLDGKNLIYSAPTSAGKTLVAEILCLQAVLERKKKAIIILPFVSVVREKMFYFQDIVSEAGIRVEGFMGSYHPPGGFKAVHIAICTIEKANNLINRLMEDNELSEVGCIVVDELHMLGDPHRGYLLELLLTKLKYISKRQTEVNIQIIGMSATLPNLDVVACWLDAALFKTDFRPIPLKEYLKIERSIYSSTNGLLHEIQPTFTVKNDPGDVIYLCIETILMGYSVLVFCPTKNWCESLAQQISAEIRRLGSDINSEIGSALRAQLNSDGISDIIERLKRCPVGLDQNLARSVAFGVSFHHAGLTMDERDIIEGSFKEGLLRVLVATTTLSSGVNLPARRVIVRSPLFNCRPLDVLTYKQMVGRAGRMGKDTEGESFLICSDKEKESGRSLLCSDLPPVSSCLVSSDLSSSLTRAVLEVVASGVAKCKEEVEEYAACTLVHTCDPASLTVPLATCLSFLEINEFTRSLQDGSIVPSPLAQATLSASLYPHQAIKLLQELHKASGSFILNNHLHAIYQVTPYSVSDQWSVDWVKMFNAWEKLSPDMKAVGRLVGVEDSFLVRAIRTNVNTDRNAERLSIHRRFYTALALQDLINEVNLSTIVEKYSCNKGMLQSLQQSSSTFAGMVTRFCERLGWTGLEAILEQLSSRIEYGAHRDLLDLLRLDCFTAQVARVLFSSGIKTVPELAGATRSTVQSALTKLKPFQSESMKTEERTSRCIWVVGKSGLTEAEAAQYFIDRARKFILKEMGVSKADWRDENKALDSIYLNSTVNPLDMSKFSESKRLSIVNDSKCVSNSTPVSTVYRKKSEALVTLSKKCKSENTVNYDKLLINHEACILDDENRVVAISPVIVDQEKGTLSVNVKSQNSPVIPCVENEFNAESRILSGNIPCSVLHEPVNKSTPKNFVVSKDDSVIPCRYSTGDLFESFDGVIFNGTSDIVVNDNYGNELDINFLRSQALQCEDRSQKEGIDEQDMTPKFPVNEVFNFDKSEDIDYIAGVHKQSLCDNDDDQLNTKDDFLSSNSKTEKPKTRNSLDAFFDSFSFNNSSFSQAVVAACVEQGQPLEELDCNCGGESLLETSLVLNNVSKQFSPLSLKRKLSISGEMVIEKRRRTSSGTSAGPSVPKKNNLSNNVDNVISNNENCVLLSNSESVKKYVPIEKKVQYLKTDNYNKTTDEQTDVKAVVTSIKNKKNFKKSSKTTNLTDIVVTSTQFPPNSEKPLSEIVNFNIGTCSEISVIKKNINECSISDSDECIIESPTLTTNKKKLKISSKLQLSNVIKASEESKDELNKKEVNSNKQHQLTGLTESYLGAAFNDSFDTVTPSALKLINSTVINDGDGGPKNVNLSKGKHNNVTATSNLSSINNIGRKSSKDNLMLESQDLFMTPPRDLQGTENGQCMNENYITTPTKDKPQPSYHTPVKHFKDKQRRASSLSPRHLKREPSFDSPSKYDKLNLKIVKTPEKSFKSNEYCCEAPLQNIPSEKKSPSGKKGDKNSSLIVDCQIVTEDKVSKITINSKCEIYPSNFNSCDKNKKLNGEKDNIISKDCLAELIVNNPCVSYQVNNNILNGDAENYAAESLPKVMDCDNKLKCCCENTCKCSNDRLNKKSCDKTDQLKSNKNDEMIKCKNSDSVTAHELYENNSNLEYIRCDRNDEFSKSNKNSFQNNFIRKESKSRVCDEIERNEVFDQIPRTEIKLMDENLENEIKRKSNETELGGCELNSNPQLIFACQSHVLLQQCEKYLSSCSEVCLSLDLSKLNENKSKIGAKMRKKITEDDNEKKFVNERVSLDGVAIYCGKNIYYFNLLCSSGLCLDIIIFFLKRIDLNLVMLEVREKLKVLYECCGIIVECHLLDPVIADWLVDPQEKNKSLSQMMKEYTELTKIPSVGYNPCTDEVIKVWHLMKSLQCRLTQTRLYKYFSFVEMPLAQILVHMELTGIGFDVTAGTELMLSIKNKMKDIEEHAFKLSNRVFNLASRNDLAKIKKIMNINSDNEKGHPLMELIQDWRKLQSLKTRNLSALLLEPKDRLHPISDTRTATGRIILYNPDLQHIPRDYVVDNILFSLRSCFIPRQGNVFVGADYCQLELRILAHYSKDKVLLESFSCSQDVFKDIAANWNQVSIDQVTDDMRHRAKQICYGLIYGMGYSCLGEQLNVSATEAAVLQAEFKRRYPGVKHFIESTVADCRKSGFIKTLFGRTRILPSINSSNPAFSKQGERQSVNSVIQGSASDIAKHALVKIETSLTELVPERSPVISDECACHLVLHLHDEFIYEVSPKYLNMLISLIKGSMEEAVSLSIPLPVKVKSGKSWGLLESVT